MVHLSPFLHRPIKCVSQTGWSLSPDGEGPCGSFPDPLDADENLDPDPSPWDLPDTLESALVLLLLSSFLTLLALESALVILAPGAFALS